MELIKLNQDKKYTSKDIAEWTEKEHKNVLRDIGDEISKLTTGGMAEFAELNFELRSNSNPDNLPSNTHYVLTKIGIQQIAMRYDAIVRAKVNQKLEELQQPKLPTNYIEALKALVIAEDEKLKLQQNLQLSDVKVENLKTELNVSELHWTIMKFNTNYKLGWDLKTCKSNGKRASMYCRVNGYAIKKCKTNDERFSEVNSYPHTVLEELFLKNGT
jgi:phage regulator Rha-like protein